MKKILNKLGLLCVITLLFVVSCNNNPDNPDNPNSPVYTSMEKLANSPDIVSVEKLPLNKSIENISAFTVIFKSGDLKIAAEFILPSDYQKAKNNYPVLIYMSDVKTLPDNLARNIVKEDIIAVHLYTRGTGESEGTTDYAGKDLADSQKLLEILDTLSFTKNSKIFVYGSSAYAITAMRLVAEDTEKRISGYNVTNPISDIKAFMDVRSETISLWEFAIGKTYEEAPEEYEKRSAVHFHEKLDRPVLIQQYVGVINGQNVDATYLIEQSDMLYDLLSESNVNCAYNKIDVSQPQFVMDEYRNLVLFIKKNNK